MSLKEKKELRKPNTTLRDLIIDMSQISLKDIIHIKQMITFYASKLTSQLNHHSIIK